MAAYHGDIRAFITPPAGSGLTAPSLIDDIHLNDPWHIPASGLDLLIEEPIRWAANGIISTLLPPDSCQHEFCAKPNQSQPPALDSRPDSTSIYKAAAVCRKCRTHVCMVVDYTTRTGANPCPTMSFPLHHLVLSPWRADLAIKDIRAGQPKFQGRVYAFECTSITCAATVVVVYEQPRISDVRVELMTDAALLKARTEQTIQTAPARFEGMKHPTPIDVLIDLRTYLKNVWTSKEVKGIKVDNKRFMLRFGPNGMPCRDLLESLYFTLEPDEFWYPPRPNAEDTTPYSDPMNTFLDDIEQELSILILQRPENERQLAQDSTTLINAHRDFSRALGCQDYSKDPGQRTFKVDPIMRAAYYTALGIPADAYENLVFFAYRQQCRSDPENIPLYLSYLTECANQRNSDVLQTQVAYERSEGKIDYQQLRDAYRYFGLHVDGPLLDDDHIIGTFQSRVQDAPKQEAEMREQLKLIGSHRKSKRILSIAEDCMDPNKHKEIVSTKLLLAINTYQQALAFLNCEGTTGDDFIVTMYASKIAEDATAHEKAFKAVRVIADTRKSSALKKWVDTGKIGETQMDTAEAYQALGIGDRTIDDDSVLVGYQLKVEDLPSEAERFNKALHVIAKDRHSQVLLQSLQGAGVDNGPQPASQDWPVGLENIGNTCYLNSLLQFLFTVPELRNLVLHFDDYKMDLSSKNIASKRVGSRHISFGEIKRAQEFVSSLRTLFEEMIKSPSTSVTPRQDLARLTLMTSTAEEKIRRRSTIASGGRPSLGHIDGLPLAGPLGRPEDEITDMLGGEAVQSPTGPDVPEPFKPSSTSPQDDHKTHLSESLADKATPPSSDVDMATPGDNSSEATLVSTPSIEDSVMIDTGVKEQQIQILEDKENRAPTKADDHTDRPPSPVKGAPLGESSPAKLNAQAGEEAAHEKSHHVGITQEEHPIYAPPPGPPPSRPPPVPPRPAPQNAMPALEEYARQQDVTEVLAHSLFQLSCAIKPTAVNEHGDQIDQVQELFYGKQKTRVLPEDSAHSINEKFLNIIARLAARPHDIYAALDTYFDVDELENGSKRYTSITDLPPIFQIHFDRVGFDPVSKSFRKLNQHVELKETIYLDRYLDADVQSTLMERRLQTWAWKKELAGVNDRIADLSATATRPDVVSALENAARVMVGLQQLAASEGDEDLHVSADSITTLEALAEQAGAEVNKLNAKVRDLFQLVETNFTDLRQNPYRLQAAFFHRGTQGSGHYWVYIYDFQKEIWRKYNDGYVTEVKDTKEIFRPPTQAELDAYSGPPNPYFLVYVRDDLKDRLVESVHRDISMPPPVLPPTPPPEEELEATGGDVQMTDQGTSQHVENVVPSWPPLSHNSTLQQTNGDFDLSGADRRRW